MNALFQTASAGTATGRGVDQLVAQSSGMAQVAKRALQSANSGASTLISGPPGSGRSTVARAIHVQRCGTHAGFLAVEGADPLLMSLESTLPSVGAVTLFIEDVERMPHSAQRSLGAWLNRGDAAAGWGRERTQVIASRETATAPRQTGIGTDHDGLCDELYYPLSIINLALPPLDQRREDIPDLADRLLTRFCNQTGRPAHTFTPDAIAALTSAAWPGNVRHLRNVVELTVTLSTSTVIPRSIVSTAISQDLTDMPTLNEARSRFERQYLVRVLRRTKGNVSRAAKLAGRDRSKFYKLLHRHELDPATFRSSASAR
ncbi:MAG: sigma 54-interacting transcriptional regulator [Pseudomonadota bacterium]